MRRQIESNAENTARTQNTGVNKKHISAIILSHSINLGINTAERVNTPVAIRVCDDLILYIVISQVWL